MVFRFQWLRVYGFSLSSVQPFVGHFWFRVLQPGRKNYLGSLSRFTTGFADPFFGEDRGNIRSL